MKQGDLVKIKEFYRQEFEDDYFSIVIDVYEDDDGFVWYKISPATNKLLTGEFWHPDYELEIVSEI